MTRNDGDCGGCGGRDDPHAYRWRRGALVVMVVLDLAVALLLRAAFRRRRR